MSGTSPLYLDSGSAGGVTVACARCHNHRFNLIIQEDCYALGDGECEG